MERFLEEAQSLCKWMNAGSLPEGEAVECIENHCYSLGIPLRTQLSAPGQVEILVRPKDHAVMRQALAYYEAGVFEPNFLDISKHMHGVQHTGTRTRMSTEAHLKRMPRRRYRRRGTRDFWFILMAMLAAGIFFYVLLRTFG